MIVQLNIIVQLPFTSVETILCTFMQFAADSFELCDVVVLVCNECTGPGERKVFFTCRGQPSHCGWECAADACGLAGEAASERQNSVYNR